MAGSDGHQPQRLTRRANRPVDQVSWNEAQTFISKLNAMEGRQLYRLPTEAEWEYAARAGSPTIYGFGNDPKQLGEYAWYRGNSGRHPHPVGQKRPNAWGLYDMLGNVWEWVQDWDGKYPTGAVTDPKGLRRVRIACVGAAAGITRPTSAGWRTATQ